MVGGEPVTVRLSGGLIKCSPLGGSGTIWKETTPFRAYLGTGKGKITKIED